MYRYDVDSLDNPPALRGRPLRYVLTHILNEHDGPMTVQQLITECHTIGVIFDGRASKLISDALRWEIRWGRVTRLARGVYTFNEAPCSTVWRIRKRVNSYLTQLAHMTHQRQQHATHPENPGAAAPIAPPPTPALLL